LEALAFGRAGYLRRQSVLRYWSSGMVRGLAVSAFLVASVAAAQAGQSTAVGPWTGNTGFVRSQPIPTPAPRAAPQPARPRFASADEIVVWMNGYRRKPEPKLVPDAVKAMVRYGVFRDTDTSGMYVGFIAGVMASNPKLADQLIEKLQPVSPEDQVMIIRALAYSGLTDWKSKLLSAAPRLPDRAVLIERYMSDKLPALDTLPLDQGPAPLDILWGHYFATGSYEPILRIVSILKWSKEGNNVERLTIGSMAKYTLASNASRDMDVLRLLKATLPAEPKTNAPILREVIEAADLGEIGKVRKDALTAIDTLKVKGSEASRNYTWWGTAGQSALALGCIVGSALGQAQIGVPCVIGGAVSGAALKAFAPKE
jgi:hypothetical protein